MKSVSKVHVFNRQSLHGLELVAELADTAERDAGAVVACGVVDANVGAVSFERDAVVAVVDGPAPEVDVRRPDSVGAVVVD